MIMKRPLFFLLALGLSILPLLGGCSGEEETTADAATETLDLAGMDPSYAPGDDFYRYANGGWLESQSIPPRQVLLHLARHGCRTEQGAAAFAG